MTTQTALAALVLTGCLSVVVEAEPPQKPAQPAKPPATVITNTANGTGNTVIISGQGPVQITNSRNGVGNRLIIRQDGKAPVVHHGVTYKGKSNKFWTKKQEVKQLGRTVYFDPKTKTWFRYDQKKDVYVPDVDYMVLLAEAEFQRELQKAQLEMQKAFEEAFPK